MTKISLRPHQQQAYSKIMQYYAHGRTKPLISMATGTGKALLGVVVGLEVGEYKDSELPGRVAFLAHTKELIEQPYNTLLDYAPYLHKKHYGKAPARGIVRAGRNQANARFLFATMQTLAGDEGKRLDEVLSHGAFDLVILDEAHHTAARSYSRIIVPKMLEANPETKLLGMTATPARSDGKALDTIFDDIVYQFNIRQAIDGGWLKPINARAVQTEVSLANIARHKGDFQETALRSALRVQNWTQIVSRAYFENDGPDRFAGSFMPSVEMGRELCDEIRAQGIPAASIDSEIVIKPDGTIVTKSSAKDYERARQYSIDSFRGGDTRMLGGYSVLLEGFDAPNMDMILQGRPTESEVLLTQLIGRGLRLPTGLARILQDSDREVYLVQRNNEDNWHEYKKEDMPYSTDCLVLDFTMKDTSVLLSGSLAGNKVPEVDEAEPEKEVMEILEVEPVPTEFDQILKRGDGVKYFKRNFFRASTDNWTFWEDGTMSAYMGAHGEGENRIANALFVYPPQKTMVSRMNAVSNILYEGDYELDQEKLDNLLEQVHTFEWAFRHFLLFKLGNIPVRVTEKNGYMTEWVKWDSPQIQVTWSRHNGSYVDHHQMWEAVLPISQELSVGGFFVDKNRAGARKKTTTKQLDLLYGEKVNNKFPNIFYTLPKRVNDAFDAVPGLDLFRINKPVRKSLIDTTNTQVSGLINHVGIYSVVMRQLLGAQLVQAQQLYNYWTAKWQQD